jgi:hypothetical protein
MQKDKKPLTSDELAKRIKQEYGSNYDAMAAYAFWRQFIKSREQGSRPARQSKIPTTERMIANLKLGIKLDRIPYICLILLYFRLTNNF